MRIAMRRRRFVTTVLALSIIAAGIPGSSKAEAKQDYNDYLCIPCEFETRHTVRNAVIAGAAAGALTTFLVAKSKKSVKASPPPPEGAQARVGAVGTWRPLPSWILSGVNLERASDRIEPSATDRAGARFIRPVALRGSSTP
jgi:hypothetical protein